MKADVAPEVPNAPSSQRKRILLVEDDLVIQKALGDILRLAGYDILSAVDGSEGVSLARTQYPDLILLDLGLPQSDPFSNCNLEGFEVMQWLPRLIREKEIPVIVITARQDALSRRTAFECGASAFLTKPFKPDQLLKAIHILLDDQ